MSKVVFSNFGNKALSIRNSNGIVLDDVTINDGVFPALGIIHIERSENIEIKNLKCFRSLQCMGIADGCSNITISGGRYEGIIEGGISVSDSSNITITDLTFKLYVCTIL